MQKMIVEKNEFTLVGMSVRTNNQLELDKLKGRIFPLIKEYFHNQCFEKIPHRCKPGTTYCAYTDYESDENGDYTYFIGEEVDVGGEVLPHGFRELTIPPQKYVKLTSLPAPMPEVIISTWKAVWEMTPQELGGQRAYLTDFEVYDERAADHQKIVLDLYIGLAK